MERQLPSLGQRAGRPITLSGGGQSPRVSPGDLITADLVNSILDRLDASERRLDALELVSGFMLGPLATGIHTLIAMSAGFEASGSSIWLDGTNLLPTSSRGINLVILSSLDLSVKFSSVYDTLVNTNASNQLVTDLQSQASHYDVVVGVTRDAYFGSGFTAAAMNALAAVGGYSLSIALTSRANAAFIGVAPANMSSVGFDYLTSVMPADGTDFVGAQLAALPFAWGLYNTSLQRFLLGGAANNRDTTGTVPAPLIGSPTITRGPGIGSPSSLINTLGKVRSGDPVNRVPGIGSAEMQLLHNNGITNIGELAKADPNRVATVLNVQPGEANRIVGGLRELLGLG